jgi:spore germination cell wall hydrolase CwlJ-like protein
VGKVILKPLQFSWTMDSDPNRSKVFDAWEKDPDGWSKADVIAWLVEHALTVDPTHGSTHYYNPSACSPRWGRGANGWVEKAVIGHHCFGTA